ncbi:putative WD-repeat protein [Trichoderma chlorosporum]
MSNPNEYTVGWICALHTEYVAAQAVLDEKHDGAEYVSTNDNNDYTLGRVGRHNVVIAVLPDGEYGTSSAASVARDLLHSFPNVRIGLMVGIGGGVPSQKHDIRLGDIVVSAPHNDTGGVLHYDFGETIQKQGFQQTRFLDQPPSVLRAAISGIKAQYESDGHQLEENINKIIQTKTRLRKKYSRPDRSSDRLYQSGFTHPLNNEASCAVVCNNLSSLVVRPERTQDEDNPAIHYGLIASGNQLIKDALLRDVLAAEKEVLCFETEAAGLMNHFPCLVIRGICDYSDSHKHQEWQGYAAMAAAAYTKDLLYRIAPNRIEAEKRITDIVSAMADVQKNTSERVIHVQQDINLAKLRPVEGAAYDSYDNEHSQCHPDTRVDLLRQIEDWVDEPVGKCIYWLKGMAGTGKSTISRTVGYNLACRGVLGASFFFKKGEGDRGRAARFFTTVASQLVRWLPALVPHVQKVIKNDPEIATKTMKEQFERLILEPLAECKDNSRIPAIITVVIDALDECDREDDARAIIYLLDRAREVTFVRLKFFVTSRPELPIRLGFKDIGDGYKDLSLHEIPKPDIEKDISTFLRFRLAQIRDDFNKTAPALPLDWPCSSSFQCLVDLAVPLFIFTATACYFIADRYCGDPEEQLDKILTYYKAGGPSQLHTTYIPVLNQLLLKRAGSGWIDRSENETAEVMEWFREIIGTIVVLANPLATASLARLLGRSQRSIDSKLGGLHSVLHIPSDPYAPVKLLHLSFHDFLVDRKNRNENPFWIDERETHEKLATNCLKLLSENNFLRENICSLQILGTLRNSVNRQKINCCLPPEVQYSCLYWVYHLKGSAVRLHDGHQALQFLQRHFLHWLEALSLLGRLSESIEFIDELQSLVDIDKGAEFSHFLHDAKRFILNCYPAVDQAPLQLYSSALVFAPQSSIIRETFQEHINWVTTKPKMERDWTPCLQTLYGHTWLINSVVFSTDSKLLASGSSDRTIRIWDVATGSCVQMLKDTVHNQSVAFSSDSNLLASASEQRDGTINIWDITTGSLAQTLTGHGDTVHKVAFSPNSKVLVSQSHRVIHIWDVATRSCVRKVSCSSITGVVFSPDSRLLAFSLGSEVFPGGREEEYTIQIWNVATWSCIKTFNGLGHHFKLVAFSPDSKFLASASRFPGTPPNEPVTISPDWKYVASGSYVIIRIWDTRAGNCIRMLEGHSGYEGEIRIWDAATGSLVQTLTGHQGHIWSIAFSTDSKLLASGSSDRTIRIWDTTTGSFYETLKDHSGFVTSVIISGNSKLLATRSCDKTIKIWDAATGSCIRALDNHNDIGRSLIFSPDSNHVVGRLSGRKIMIWDAKTGSLLKTVESEWENLWMFSTDSKLLASGSSDRTIRIWDTATWSLIQTLEGHNHVCCIAFAIDPKLLASGSYDNTATIWDITTGSCIHTLTGHSDSVYSVAFSAESKLMASGSGDETVKIWDVATGSCVQTLEGHSDIVKSVVFSPDSMHLASGSTGSDRTMKIWNLATGSCIQKLEAGKELYKRISFDATGSHLLTRLGTKTLSKCTDLHANEAQESRFVGYALSANNSWIMWNGNNVLWLPPEYRPQSNQYLVSPSRRLSEPTSESPSTRTTVAIGCESGRVLVFGFSDSGPRLN